MFPFILRLEKRRGQYFSDAGKAKPKNASKSLFVIGWEGWAAQAKVVDLEIGGKREIPVGRRHKREEIWRE